MKLAILLLLALSNYSFAIAQSNNSSKNINYGINYGKMHIGDNIYIQTLNSCDVSIEIVTETIRKIQGKCNGKIVYSQYELNKNRTLTLPFLKGASSISSFVIDNSNIDVHLDAMTGTLDNSKYGGFVIGNNLSFHVTFNTNNNNYVDTMGCKQKFHIALENLSIFLGYSNEIDTWSDSKQDSFISRAKQIFENQATNLYILQNDSLSFYWNKAYESLNKFSHENVYDSTFDNTFYGRTRTRQDEIDPTKNELERTFEYCWQNVNAAYLYGAKVYNKSSKKLQKHTTLQK